MQLMLYFVYLVCISYVYLNKLLFNVIEWNILWVWCASVYSHLTKWNFVLCVHRNSKITLNIEELALFERGTYREHSLWCNCWTISEITHKQWHQTADVKLCKTLQKNELSSVGFIAFFVRVYRFLSTTTEDEIKSTQRICCCFSFFKMFEMFFLSFRLWILPHFVAWLFYLCLH